MGADGIFGHVRPRLAMVGAAALPDAVGLEDRDVAFDDGVALGIVVSAHACVHELIGQRPRV